jgi:glycine/D-amino acid oxidase-like deaminating enzyme
VPDDWDVLYSPQAGFLETEPSLRALAAAARDLGVDIHEEEPALAWGATGDGVWVRTARDTYRADRLIVAAGAWAGTVLADLGLPLTVLRKTLWWLAVEDPAPFHPDRFPIFISGSDFGEIYGFPIHDGRGLKCANHLGGEPTDPDTADRSTHPGEAADVLTATRALFRGVTNRVLESTVCLYTSTPDTDFIVDRHPADPRLTIAAGFSGHGFKFATAIGEHLADLALDPTTTPYLRLALTRFGSNATAA